VKKAAFFHAGWKAWFDSIIPTISVRNAVWGNKNVETTFQGSTKRNFLFQVFEAD